jgi:transcriptional regulator with XRE-family HTH domain
MPLNIAKVAKKKGWTLKRVADELDQEYQTVLYWNQGRSYPRVPTLFKLCQILDCTLDDLMEPLK